MSFVLFNVGRGFFLGKSWYLCGCFGCCILKVKGFLLLVVCGIEVC